MGKGLDKFLNLMRLNDDDYDDEYDDEYDEYDDEGYEDEPEPVVKKKRFTKSSESISAAPEKSTSVRPVSTSAVTPTSTYSPRPSSRSNNKIVPIKTHTQPMEVCVIRPTNFDDSKEICDILLTGRAAIANMEGIDVESAQQIIHFISGACYAIQGNIQKISHSIFIITPENIDISGDIQSVLGPAAPAAPSGSKAVPPAFKLNL